jgi:hypothetical protein
MGKWIVGILALVGCMFLLTSYAPSVWTSGFHVIGFHIRWAFVVLGGVAFMAYKLKGK